MDTASERELRLPILENEPTERAEEAVLKAGALQNAIFSSADFSCIATDAKGVIQIFNVGAERLLGYTAAEVMNKITPADISDPQELIAHAKALSDELATPITPGFEALVFKASRGIEDFYELTYIRKDGTRLPAVVSVTALRDAQDAITGYLLIATDNTARKRGEQVLREGEEQYHAMSMAAQDAMIALDDAGRIVLWNQSASRLFGYTAQEAHGQELHLLLAPVRYLAAYKAAWPRFAKDGEGAPNGQVTELAGRRKDDSEFPIELSLSAVNLKGHWHAMGVVRDITERKQAEEALRESEGKLRTIMESVDTGIVIIDPDFHKIVEVNAAAARMIGASKEEIEGSVCHSFICPAEVGKCPITDLHQPVDHSERVLLTATGARRPIIKSVTKVLLGGKEYILENFIDITERKQAEELSRRDSLTELYNHRTFYALLKDELVRTQRFNHQVSLLMLDIDHFKRVNDTHGHPVGDVILKSLGDLLLKQARAVDRVCRYGGEEFTVILPETDAAAAMQIAERLRAEVDRQPFDIGGGKMIGITVSIGVATYPQQVDSLEGIIKAADVALYAAKHAGRNRVSHYKTGMPG